MNGYKAKAFNIQPFSHCSAATLPREPWKNMQYNDATGRMMRPERRWVDAGVDAVPVLPVKSLSDARVIERVTDAPAAARARPSLAFSHRFNLSAYYSAS